jgi:hypothetical protein
MWVLTDIYLSISPNVIALRVLLLAIRANPPFVSLKKSTFCKMAAFLKDPSTIPFKKSIEYIYKAWAAVRRRSHD